MHLALSLLVMAPPPTLSILFPYTTLCRSVGLVARRGVGLVARRGVGLVARRGVGLVARRGVGLVARRGVGLVARRGVGLVARRGVGLVARRGVGLVARRGRSEEHTSELQSREKLVCRLLLEKKKNSATETNDRS